MDVVACEKADVPIIRRMTGGRGILHGNDLTLGIVAPLAALGIADGRAIDVVGLYRRLAEGIIRSFAALGVHSTVGDGRAAAPHMDAGGDCMHTIAKADIIERDSGVKLVGSAILRRGSCVLQQSSIPCHSSHMQMDAAPSCFRSRLAAVPPSTQAQIQMSDLLEALVEGIGGSLTCRWTSEPLTEYERRRGEELATLRYLDERRLTVAHRCAILQPLNLH
jgi:lipoate-protein ligase A